MTDELERMFPDYRIACDEKAGTVLKQIVVVPDGKVKSRSGDFHVDEEAWRLINAAFSEHGIDVVVDYEHQTLGGEYSSPSGRAPAAGWIKALTYEPGRGIVADVEWLSEAQRLLGDKAYRYLSPVAEIRKSDRKMVRLHSVALTNTPAILRMEAIAAKALASEENDVTKAKKVQVNQDPAPAEGEGGGGGVDEIMTIIGAICNELGIPIEGSVPELLKAIHSKISGGGESGEEGPAAEEASKAREVLGLPAEAGKRLFIAKLNEVVGHVGYVPAKEYTALKGRLETIEQANAERASTDLVAEYVESGKLNPDNEDQMKWAHAQAKTNTQAFKTLMDHAPDIRPPQGLSTPPKGGKSASGSRATIIANAAKEFDGQEPAYQRLANKRELVDHALVMSNHKVLTDDEALTYGV